MGEYRKCVLETYIIITTLILTSKVLRWGGGGGGQRPRREGKWGARSAGEGAGARGGGGGNRSGKGGWGAEPLLLFIIIKIFENICDIKILMIISQIDIFENV